MQIAERLCDEILQGKYPPGERIPSVREYSALVEVNVNTTMRSYDLLQKEGVITSKRGLGYFVDENAKELIVNDRKKKFIAVDVPEFIASMKSLGLTWDDIRSLE